MPTTTQGNYSFEGWEPASATVTGDTVFTAKFDNPVDVSEITDSWDTIIANIDNGTYSTRYKLGQYKPLDLGTEGTINMQIVAIDGDELTGGGTAPLSFVGMELLATKKSMPVSSTAQWGNCDMRSYLSSSVLALIPSNVRNRICSVNKVQAIYDGELVVDGQTTSDKLWIPSDQEIRNTARYETGLSYNSIYKDKEDRKKSVSGTATAWWLRSAVSAALFRYVSNAGGDYQKYVSQSSALGVCLGFCLGLASE